MGLESRRAMGRAFQSLPREHGFEPLRVEGTIPDALRGTLFKNGPALFESQGTPYRHWLDGDGAITAVRFADGRADGAVRVIATKELEEERRAGKMLYSSGFTKGPSWHRRLFARSKNATNVHVLLWQGRLYAVSDMGVPYEIDRDTLETLGPSTLGGALDNVMNAHVRVHPKTGATYGFGPVIGMRSGLDVFELPAHGNAKRLVRIPMKTPPMLIHDFALSNDHLIFVKPPIGLRVFGLMMGIGTPMDAITLDEEKGCEIIVVPLADPSKVRTIHVPTFFHFHLANAFEAAPGTLAVDLCRYPSFDLGDAFLLDHLRSGEGWLRTPHATLARVTINVAKGDAELAPLWDVNCDFPSTAPSKQGLRARYLWASVTRDHVDRITKLDHESGDVLEAEFEAHELTGEPTFVPRPGAPEEDDGWLLTIAYDANANTSFAAILDARDPRVILARAYFDHHVAFPLHGAFDRA